MSFSIHFTAVRFMLAHTIWEPCLSPFFSTYNFKCLCVLFLKNKIKNKICSMCEVPRCPYRIGLESTLHKTWHRSTKKRKKKKMVLLTSGEQCSSLNINQAHTYKQHRGKATWHSQKWLTMAPLTRSALTFLLPRDKLFRPPGLNEFRFP